MWSWWNSLEAVSKFNNWMVWIAAILAILAAICGVLIIVSGNRKDELKTKQDEQIKEQTEEREAELRSRVETAETSTSNVRKDLTDAQQKQVEAEHSLQEMQERDRPRTLNDEQRALLLKSLRKQENKGKIEIVFHSGGSGDAGDFATMFFQILKEAGWDIGLGPVTPPTHISGLVIQVHDLNKAPAHALALQQAFKAAGISFRTEAYPVLGEEEVYLFVGSKY